MVELENNEGPAGKFVELKFVNSDARPKVKAVLCDTSSIATIMAWYGAYYAGDRYSVFADAVKLPKDRNGELLPSPIAAQESAQ